MADRALVLAGPTASGKTALGLEIARRLPVEIISADSRQVYQGMDIGTAKVSAAEREPVPHHGLDLVRPDQRYSAGRFARDCHRWVQEIQGRGRIPLILGGTGFFLRAVLQPLFREPHLDASARVNLGRYLGALEDPELRRWLAALDPGAAVRLETGGGRQRVLRALEMALLTGRPLSWWHRSRPPDQPPLDATVFVLDLARDRLYERINHRVDEMVEAGLVDEVRGLLAQGFGAGDPGMSATGYPETIAYLRQEIGLEEAMERTRHATRRYARRQLTWFRNQMPAGATWLDAAQPMTQLADQVVQRWQIER
jgi:tRNA dimethylallyltransferase